MNYDAYRSRTGVLGSRVASAILLLTVVGTELGCSIDPFERYASTVRRDVGVPIAALNGTTTRLQSTVVHGHVPLDSARIWNKELTKTVAVFRDHAAHLGKTNPPDSGLVSIRDGLVLELNTVADTVGALNSDIALCVDQNKGKQPVAAVTQSDSGAGADSDSTVDCRTTVGVALSRLLKGVSYTQDELRWTLQRAGRKLATHGVLLGRSA